MGVAPQVTPNSATRSTPTQQIISGPQYSTSNILNPSNSEAKLDTPVVPSSNTNDENNPNMNNITNIGNNSSDSNIIDNNNVVSKMPDDLGHSSASNSLISSSPM